MPKNVVIDDRAASVRNKYLTGRPDTLKNLADNLDHVRLVVVRGHPCIYVFNQVLKWLTPIRKMADNLKFVTWLSIGHPGLFSSNTEGSANHVLTMTTSFD